MKKPASDKYNITIEPGVYQVHGFGEIDLRSLTLERAEQLFKKGFPYLELKPTSQESVKAPKTKKLKTKNS